jgi:hypothetical protein
MLRRNQEADADWSALVVGVQCFNEVQQRLLNTTRRETPVGTEDRPARSMGRKEKHRATKTKFPRERPKPYRGNQGQVVELLRREENRSGNLTRLPPATAET